MAERIFVNALRQHPNLREIETKLKTLITDKNAGQKSAASEIKALEKQKSDYLIKIGLSKELLNPQPSCTACFDSGYSNNKICSCIISLVASTTASTISFDNFDISVFDDLDKQKAAESLEYAKTFCNRFPATNKLNLLFFGKPGTGKTFLASCIADELTQKGFSVIFTTAFGFLNKALAYHTAFAEDKYA